MHRETCARVRGDPAWSNFKTYAQYKKDFLERANFYIDKAEDAADIIQLMASGGVFSRNSNFKARMKFAEEEANTARNTRGSNPFLTKTKDQLLSDKETFEAMIKEHKEKLAKFIEDPIANSDPKWLK